MEALRGHTHTKADKTKVSVARVQEAGVPVLGWRTTAGTLGASSGVMPEAVTGSKGCIESYADSNRKQEKKKRSLCTLLFRVSLRYLLVPHRSQLSKEIQGLISEQEQRMARAGTSSEWLPPRRASSATLVRCLSPPSVSHLDNGKKLVLAL